MPDLEQDEEYKGDEEGDEGRGIDWNLEKVGFCQPRRLRLTAVFEAYNVVPNLVRL